VKIHLGCGDIRLPGFVNVDVRPLTDKTADARDLPYGDESVDLVYASHLLEHFWPREAGVAVREWHRVLRPGGTLRLAIPDFAAITSRYAATNDLPELRGLLYGSRVYPDYPEDAHHSCWDRETLTDLLETAGFVEAQSYDWRQTEHAAIIDCASAYLPRGDFARGQHMSLNMEARKP